MRSLKYYDPIKEEKYDTYRDLHSIFCDRFSLDRGFTEKNTILVDSESRKVQLWLDNSIVSEPYLKEDVCLLPSKAPSAQTEPIVRNNEWQEAYMEELTAQILDVVENAGDDVPAYLRQHRQAKFSPEVLLPQLAPDQLLQARRYVQEADVAEESSSATA